MPLLFTMTLFVSAGLLFWLQPMVGKMVLPALGGTPAVWNTCMVFFQAGLLAGYAYAHGISGRLGTRAQIVLHMGLVLLPVPMLPILLIETAPPPDSNAVFWLLGVLLVQLGVPFIVIATSAPLLQRWFAAAHKTADPYYLYAASNLGSLLALVSYPLLIEPTFTLSEQSTLWAAGYAVLAALIATSAIAAWRRTDRTTMRVEASDKGAKRPAGARERPVSAVPRLRWLVLALVPSSLMLSVTTHLTTDLAPIPLLWVLPLALYLLTFVLAFARRQWLDVTAMARVMPIAVLVLVLVYLLEAQEPLLIVLGLDLVGFFVIALVCHGELARSRPTWQHLTEYYLWLALGGVLGGVLNALVAPLLFDRLAEYPLMLVAACLLSPAPTKGEAWSKWDVLLPLAIGALTAGLVLGTRWMGVSPSPLAFAPLFGVPLLLAYLLHEWPVRFGLSLALILLLSAAYPGVLGPTEYRARSFFAAHRVTRDTDFRYLVHGNTVHGQQSRDPTKQGEPLTYYHRESPVGRVFAAWEHDPRLQRVGLIGLGTGALACYASPGQRWTFFEIDPAVIHISRDSGLFSYVRRRRGEVDVQCGDGRLLLERSAERFGVIVIDAFNSDAIPLHLLTHEALHIYKSRLHEGGVLVFHISNRYVDLEPILANLAAEGPRPMIALARRDDRSSADREKGLWSSRWVVLLSRPDDEKRLPGWTRLSANPAYPIWTDDFSSIFPVLRLSQPTD